MSTSNAVRVAGRTVEWVFAGQARFRFEPPDEIEADQLELFSGQRELDVCSGSNDLFDQRTATVTEQ